MHRRHYHHRQQLKHYCYCNLRSFNYCRSPLILLVVVAVSSLQCRAAFKATSTTSTSTISTDKLCSMQQRQWQQQQQHRHDASTRRKINRIVATSTPQLYTTINSAGSDSDIIRRRSVSDDDDNSSRQSHSKQQPHWIPMELVELISEDLHLTQDEFIHSHVDVEAYTSCDDEGDDFHECDFFQHYLGPTKWVHLTKPADAIIDEVHLDIWKDVWSHPHEAIDVAEKVSKECLRYCKEFMLESRTSSDEYPSNDNNTPNIRVKVIPASFGLDGFEEAIWEATESMMMRKRADTCTKGQLHAATLKSLTNESCQAITLVVAAPDLFTDPILLDGVSPQAEFESDRFRAFSTDVKEKLALINKVDEGSFSNDDIHITTYHPLWRRSDSRERSTAVGQQFPYPCVAISRSTGGLGSDSETARTGQEGAVR